MVRITIPKPKKTPRTAPIAASSGSLVRREIHSIMTSPIKAVIADPARRPMRFQPSPPSKTIKIKASPTPGNVA